MECFFFLLGFIKLLKAQCLYRSVVTSDVWKIPSRACMGRGRATKMLWNGIMSCDSNGLWQKEGIHQMSRR